MDNHCTTSSPLDQAQNSLQYPDVHFSSIEREFEDESKDVESGYPQSTPPRSALPPMEIPFTLIHRRTRSYRPEDPSDTWMTKDMLRELAGEYSWMRNQFCVLPEKGMRYSQAPSGYITVFLCQVECGFRYPMDPGEVRVLNDLQISPSQFHPNG
ncbi:hypothetical protein M5689_012929 [Euphorbia peplus]|nr:hypothetical protein M5689_012929 [Euphorbia peplus]